MVCQGNNIVKRIELQYMRFLNAIIIAIIKGVKCYYIKDLEKCTY